MEQMPFHPSVNVRARKLGKNYEKLQAAAYRTIEDIAAFCDRSGPILKQFAAYNDQLIHLLKEEKVPRHLLREQIETSDAVADLAKQFHAIFAELVYGGRPKIDRIIEHGSILTAQMETLLTLRLQKDPSEALLRQMEEQMNQLAQGHTDMRQLFNACISLLQQMQATLKRSIN